ncbi:MAG: oligosaccharide flippase family protein [Endozoicomonadaceae bacterium]|nr:oligosaccharide flippase family protein [Endozoicomonadaceae bacterium]
MKAKIRKAGLLVTIAFGLSQVIRLGGNLIVARLLTPEMFGVMAIVYAFTFGIGMFSDLGFWAYIVRNKDYKNPKILNTVWSLQVVRGWLMFAIIIICALMLYGWQKTVGDVSVVYSNEFLPFILIVISITALLKGYKTLAPAVLGRELNRGRLEFVELVAQGVGTVVMVIWAIYAPSIWALVSASIISSLAALILNYSLFEFRHKFSWDKKIVREVFHFGKWIVLASGITFLAKQSDKIFFSVYMSPAQLGIYSIAFLLAGFISAFIEKFTNKIWLPVFSEVKENSSQLAKVYYKVRLRQDFFVSLGVILLGLCSPWGISILYDQRYIAAGWMIQILLISAIGLSITTLSKSLLVALGHTKVQMQVMMARVLSLVVLIPILHDEYGLQGAIYAVALSSYIGIPIQYIKMKKAGVLSLMKEMRIAPFALLFYTITVLQFYPESIYQLMFTILKSI